MGGTTTALYEDESVKTPTSHQNLYSGNRSNKTYGTTDSQKVRKSKLDKIKELQRTNSILLNKQSQLKRDINNLTKESLEIKRTATIQITTMEIQVNEAKKELAQ